MKYELHLIRDDEGSLKGSIVATWKIPQIIKKAGGIKVKFLPSLREIKKAIKEDILCN